MRDALRHCNTAALQEVSSVAFPREHYRLYDVLRPKNRLDEKASVDDARCCQLLAAPSSARRPRGTPRTDYRLHALRIT